MSKFKDQDFLIKHLLTDAQYTLSDLCYLNQGNHNTHMKCPLFMADIKVKQPTLPDGVKFAVTRLEDRPAGKPAPILYQEILLSYLGNAAKTELEKNDWRPKAMTKLDKVDPEEALAQIYSDYKTRIFRMCTHNNAEITIGSWIKSVFSAYCIGQSGNTGVNYETIALKVLKQMHLHKIEMPTISKELHKYLNTLVTLDENTGLVTSLTPAPAAPVSADAPVEKKSPQENESPSKPEKISIAITADPRPVNLPDIFETLMMDTNPAQAYTANPIQVYATNYRIHDEVVYTPNTALPVPNVQIPE